MPLLASWLWLLIALLPLVLLERWVHRHLQGLWLLLLRDADLALILYSLVMLPGVLLHEGSHWLAATLLLVRAGRFSVIPARLPDGTLRLGYVETQPAGAVREAVIGAAPLALGSLVIVVIGDQLLGLAPLGGALVRGDLLALLAGLADVFRRPDSWFWLYLLFTIANAMLPSASDRRAWWPVLLLLAALAAVAFALGIGDLLVDAVTEPLSLIARTLAAAFTITVGLNAAIMPMIWLLERGLMRVTGLKVEY